MVFRIRIWLQSTNVNHLDMVARQIKEIAEKRRKAIDAMKDACVVGLGKIGREVIQHCRSFNMNIMGYDPYVSQDMFNEDEVQVVDLDTLTTVSDYITLHVPLIDSTKNLFDYDRLCQMKDTARIINVARGGIINEADLAKALN